MKRQPKPSFMDHWQLLHDHPPAPFNPLAVQETAAEKQTREEADRAFCTTLPDVPEEEKRPLRAAFRRTYWDDFVAKKRPTAR